MKALNFSNLESEVLSAINQGHVKYENLVKNVSMSEQTLYIIIEGLIAKNIINFNSQTNDIEYQTKIDGEIVILEGNILLPTTVLKFDDKILVCRGQWYEFPADFDTRRIVWNVQLDQKTNSTLIDMINASILKEKKSKIRHSEQYDNIKNKIVPFSDEIGLYLNSIGDEMADISILFRTIIAPNTDALTKHSGFKINTTITTKELMDQLALPPTERNYQENIKLNRIFNFDDVIFSNNEIPIKLENGILTYIKLTGVKKKFELTYHEMYVTGVTQKIDIETFDSIEQIIQRVDELFNFAETKLNRLDFEIERE